MVALAIIYPVIAVLLALPLAFKFQAFNEQRREAIPDVLFCTTFNYYAWLYSMLLSGGAIYLLTSFLPESYAWIIPIPIVLLFAGFWLTNKYTYIREDAFGRVNALQKVADMKWHPLTDIDKIRYKAGKYGYRPVLYTRVKGSKRISLIMLESNTTETLDEFLKRKQIPGFQDGVWPFGMDRLW